MRRLFMPRLDCLPPPQRRLWSEFAEVPPDFTLWGGTALALHLGHRSSIDFDFFCFADYDLSRLIETTQFLGGINVSRRDPRSLTGVVERDGPVKVSFFTGLRSMNPLRRPLAAPDNGLAVADLLDLAASKVKVVCDRAEAKDYHDIDAVLRLTDIGLGKALSAASMVYGANFAPVPSLKALTYFEDGDLPQLPKDVRARLVAAVRTVDPTRLPRVSRRRPGGRERD